MYTELFIKCEMKSDLPKEVLNVLKYLFGDEDLDPGIELPEHDFFKCERWRFIGNGYSHYFAPFATSEFRKNYLISRSDLKNYNDEIERFLDWVMPYIAEPEGQFIGYHIYEESDTPTLIYKYDEEETEEDDA